MAGGRAARACARGGEDIPAQRGGSLIAGAGALLVLVALGGYAAAVAGSLAPLAGAAVLGGLVLVLLALLGFVKLLGWGLALVAAAYLLVDLARSVPLAAAPFFGAGLLLAGELAYAARELWAFPEERPLRRVPWLAGVALCALGAGFLPIAATGARAPAGLAAEIVALVAACALMSIPALLARRREVSDTARGGGRT